MHILKTMIAKKLITWKNVYYMTLRAKSKTKTKQKQTKKPTQ